MPFSVTIYLNSFYFRPIIIKDKGLSQNNLSISLVFWPVRSVTKRVAYNEYAPLFVPCGQTKIRRDTLRLYWDRL